jgi:hypothetical protein
MVYIFSARRCGSPTGRAADTEVRFDGAGPLESNTELCGPRQEADMKQTYRSEVAHSGRLPAPAEVAEVIRCDIRHASEGE